MIDSPLTPNTQLPDPNQPAPAVDPSTGAITQGVYQTQASDVLNQANPDIDIDVVNPDGSPLEGTVVEIDIEVKDDHNDNLLETLFKTPEKQRRLAGLASDLITQYEEDLRSRDKWEKTYREGLKLLGLQLEDRTDPWDGACGVFHPLLTEAVVRFQSEAITETFPAHGPVKTQILGKQTPERLAAADRVKDDMNWRLTDEMPEYRVEHERLLWSLPIAGSAFKKVYFDDTLGRQTAMFVPAEDIVVNYGASDMHSAERITHVMRRSENWLQRMMDAGVYIEQDLSSPTVLHDETQTAKDDVTGMSSTNSEQFVVLEMLVNLDIESKEDSQAYDWPYVVTINRSTNELLAIRRNWEKDDDIKKKLQHFVHYTYITGFGFYGFGLVHLVGGHAKAGTSLLRQLVDAGTLSNLPGGFKTRGLRIKGDDTPIRPAEFRDVDVPSGTIKDNILPLPYKEPSSTLFNLLQSIVEDGRKAAAISDAAFSDANQNAPVGTTLALIERQLKTLAAVQARVHAAMRIEFKLIKALVRDNGQRAYPYDVDPDKATKKQDYDVTDIIPVSDPNATTMGIRIAQYQAAFDLAQRAPQLYDQAFLHREMLQTLGIKNVAKIIPMPDDQQPRDPVSENMAILMSKPVRAFIQQDHQSHIMTHQAFMQDPKIGMLLGQNPNAQMMFNAMSAHIAEHAAYAYRAQIQQAMGTTLPDPNQPMDPHAEYVLAGLLAQAAAQVQAQNKNQQAQAQAQQQAQDPLVQMQQQELQLKGREVAVKESDAKLKWAVAQGEGKIPAPQQPGQPQAPQQAPAVAQQQQIAQAQAAQKMQHDQQAHELQQAAAMAQAQNQQRLAVAQSLADHVRKQQTHEYGLRTQHAQNVAKESRSERAHRVKMALAAQAAEQKNKANE